MAPIDSDPLTVLRDLYASEINCSIASFWDGGYHVKLGDNWNGWLAEQIGLMSWEELAAWLKETAIRQC